MMRAPGSTVPEISRYAEVTWPKVELVVLDPGRKLVRFRTSNALAAICKVTLSLIRVFFCPFEVEVALPWQIEEILISHLTGRGGADVRCIRIDLGGRQAVFPEKPLRCCKSDWCCWLVL